MSVLVKTDSEVSSLSQSSPARSPRRPVYYVQSPSRDSHDGEKTTNSFNSSPVLSPILLWALLLTLTPTLLLALTPVSPPPLASLVPSSLVHARTTTTTRKGRVGSRGRISLIPLKKKAFWTMRMETNISSAVVFTVLLLLSASWCFSLPFLWFCGVQVVLKNPPSLWRYIFVVYMYDLNLSI